MSRARIYVGNIPFTATEQDLRALFAGFEVSHVKIITDRETNRPRGFAFVELVNGGDLDRAVSSLDRKDMGGRTINVSPAKERERSNAQVERRDRR